MSDDVFFIIRWCGMRSITIKKNIWHQDLRVVVVRDTEESATLGEALLDDEGVVTLDLGAINNHVADLGGVISVDNLQTFWSEIFKSYQPFSDLLLVGRLVRSGHALVPECSQRCETSELGGLFAELLAHHRLHNRVKSSERVKRCEW